MDSNERKNKKFPENKGFFKKSKNFSKKRLTNSEKGYIMQYGKELARANSNIIIIRCMVE